MDSFKLYLLFHSIAFAAGFFLDLIIGDPHWIYHPVRAMGFLISTLEKLFLKEKNRDNSKKQLAGGIGTVLIVLLFTLTVSGAILFLSYRINKYFGLAVEAVMSYFIFAARSLGVESMKVYQTLEKSTLEDARKAVSMIVGRDTNCLDEEGVIRATVETVAENTSDGVVAPMIFTFLGGPVVGFVYKAVNTMDSMIGYKNGKYFYFGKAAAKLDDLVNFIPARISALLMITATLIAGKEYSFRNAVRIFKRDRYNHASPNSAQTESVCAGALQVRLAGDASYFGKIVHKPYIGDPVREIERKDIKRACRLMYISAFLCMIVCEAILLGTGFVL